MKVANKKEQSMFTLAIVGYREFRDYARLCAIMDQVKTPVDRIVSGGARGADTLAEKYAKEHGIEMIVHPAQWDKYGKSAGYKRNQYIVDDANAMIAFLHPQSKGTKNSVGLAQKKGIPVFIVHL